MIDDSTYDEAARLLAEAARTRTPITPLSDRWPDLDQGDAYRIAQRNVDARVAAGAIVKGHKVGLSSRAMQQQLGVDQPDYGALLHDMFVDEDSGVPFDRFLQPRVEVEVAMVLGRRLEGPGVTVADACRATELLLPALEIVDSRIIDWRCRLVDTVADNASTGALVLAGRPRRPCDLDVRAVGARLYRNGELCETGAAGAVLGNPFVAVAWLANVLGSHGVALEEGHIVLPGSCTRMIAVRPGDGVRADVDGFGHVACTFTGEDLE